MEGKLESDPDSDILSFLQCPEKPNESDCCGSGCSECVFDIYNKQLLSWQQKIEAIKCKNTIQSVVAVSKQRVILSQERFLPFQLHSIQQHTGSAFLFTFQAVRKVSEQQTEFIPVHEPLGIGVGQYLIMKCNIQNSEKVYENSCVLTRAYTPISGSKSNMLGRFKVLIKLYKGGKMSHYLKSLKEQDITFWKGPCGNFEYYPNSYHCILMLCAGTGIAPMLNIARAVVKNEDDETSVRLLFACKNSGDILLRPKLQQLTGYWNFSAEIFLSSPQENNEIKNLYHENIIKCKINSEIIKKELSNIDPNNILVLICGPESFNKDMMYFANDSGVSDENIFIF